MFDYCPDCFIWLDTEMRRTRAKLFLIIFERFFAMAKYCMLYVNFMICQKSCYKKLNTQYAEVT